MASDVFSGYFSDEDAPATSGNDVYSSYFPQDAEETPQVDTSGMGVLLHSLNALPSGIESGTANMLMEGAKGVAYGANKLGYPNTANNINQGVDNFRGMMNEDNETMDPLTRGIYTAGQTIPAAAITPGIGAINGLKGAASIIPSGVQGAAQGVFVNALNPTGSADSLQDRATQGAEFGGALGVAGAGLGVAGSLARDALTGGDVSPQVADLASVAKNKYGVDLYAPQISNSPFLKYLDSATGTIPLSGGAARSEQQYGQLAKAVANEIGAPNLSQEGFSQARTNFGKMYDSVANNTMALGDQKLLDGLDQVENDAKLVVGNKLQPVIDSIRAKINNTPMTSVAKDSNDISTASGLMSGKDYKQLTASGTPLDRLTQSSDPNVSFYANQIQNHLDGALARAASPEDLQTLRTADIGYAKMMKLKSLALAADPEGNVTPAKMASVLRNANKGNEFGDYPDNNLKQLSDIATLMKAPPSSGTTERGLAYASTIFPAERLMQGDVHGALLDAGAAAGIMGSSRIAQSTMNSQWYKNKLLQSAMDDGGSFSGLGNKSSVNPLIPYASVVGPQLMNPQGSQQ